jgi:hypothetical protein
VVTNGQQCHAYKKAAVDFEEMMVLPSYDE